MTDTPYTPDLPMEAEQEPQFWNVRAGLRFPEQDDIVVLPFLAVPADGSIHVVEKCLEVLRRMARDELQFEFCWLESAPAPENPLFDPQIRGAVRARFDQKRGQPDA